MDADGQYSGREYGQDTKDVPRRRRRRRRRWRGGIGLHVRWPHRKVVMSLLGRRKRALDRIEQALLAEDPGLGLRFAFFTRLTGHEAIPLTEQVPGRLQRFRRRASVGPLVVISLAALLGAAWLIPSRHTCPAGLTAAAHTLSSLARAGHCQPGPAVKLDPMPLH